MNKKRLAFLILSFIILQTIFVIPSQAASSREKDPAIAILFTNDVHCYYDRDIGYDGLVLYKKELEQQYES